jgi:hypothetical protein
MTGLHFVSVDKRIKRQKKEIVEKYLAYLEYLTILIIISNYELHLCHIEDLSLYLSGI